MKFFFILFYMLIFVNVRSEESLAIDKDNVFGLPWDSKIEEFKKKLGQPMGVLNLLEDNIIYIWNGDFGLEFNNKSNKLIKIYISPSFLPIEISSKVKKVFEIEKIIVGKGLKIGMTKEAMVEVLGKNDKPTSTPDFELFYKTDNGLNYRINFSTSYTSGKNSILVYELVITKEI